MEINRCVGCMNELKPGERYCPVCGCDNLNIEQPSYALRPHTILHGRYLIGKVLGKGGFGITYIGLDLTLNVKVAVKEYFPMGEVFYNCEHLGTISVAKGCQVEDLGDNSPKVEYY